MTRIDAKYVIERLAEGVTVICCDFKTMRMVDCTELKISSLLALVKSTDCAFFAKA